MRENRFFIAAGIFLALTLIKLTMPELAGALREDISREIDRNIDYTAAVEALGRHIEEYVQVFAPAESQQPEPEAAQPVMAVTCTTEETAGTPAPSAEPDQSAGTSAPGAGTDGSAGLPADGTLPFEFTAPVMAEVSSPFGEREHPIYGGERFHYGTDFAAAAGDAILAFADGTVTAAEFSHSYGNYIVIDHGGGYTSLYAHCSELMARAGDSVAAGQQIATVGDTGNVTGPHLHFELRCGDEYIDPEAYLC